MPEIDTVYRFQRSTFIAGDEGYDLKIKSRPFGRLFYCPKRISLYA